MAITPEQFKLKFSSAHHSRYLMGLKGFAKQNSKILFHDVMMTSYKCGNIFFKNVKSLGQFYDQNSAFELKADMKYKR